MNYLRTFGFAPNPHVSNTPLQPGLIKPAKVPEPLKVRASTAPGARLMTFALSFNSPRTIVYMGQQGHEDSCWRGTLLFPAQPLATPSSRPKASMFKEVMTTPQTRSLKMWAPQRLDVCSEFVFWHVLNVSQRPLVVHWSASRSAGFKTSEQSTGLNFYFSSILYANENPRLSKYLTLAPSAL